MTTSTSVLDTIGFGQINFALSTLIGIMHTSDPSIETSVTHLPACFRVWMHLAITQLLFPRSHFLGHLIGAQRATDFSYAASLCQGYQLVSFELFVKDPLYGLGERLHLLFALLPDNICATGDTLVLFLKLTSFRY